MNKNVIKELALYLPAKIIEGILGIVLVSVYTYHMNEAVFGQYSLVNTTTMTAFLPICGWLMHAGYRHILEYSGSECESDFHGSVWSLWLVLQLVMLVLVGFIYLLFANFREWLIYVPVLFVPYSAVQVLSAQMTATKRIGHVIILTTCDIALRLLLAVLFMRIMQPLIAVVAAHSMGNLITFSIVFCATKMAGHINSFKIDPQLAGRFFRYGLPLIGLALTIAITNFSDRWIIGWLFGDAAVGIYHANYTIASASFTFIMIGIMRAVHPNILKAWQSGKETIETDIWQGLRLYLLIALPAALGITILAEPISGLILHPNYHDGYSVAMWVSLGMLMLGISEYIIKPLELNKRTHPIFICSLLSAIVNVLLNVVLVPKMGYTFAATTTFIAYLVYVVLLVSYVRRRYTLYIEVSSVLKVAMAATVMATFTYYWRGAIDSFLKLALLVLTSMVVYLIALLLSGEINKEIALITKRNINIGGK